MEVQTVPETRRFLVLVRARSLEHAEAVATELAAQGLRVACLELPADADVCATCGPMRQAAKTAFMEGVITAAILGAIASVLLSIVLQWL